MLTRNDGRAPEMGRPVTIETDFVRTADGSCLICTGNTKVICTASVEENVPPFLRGKGQGWVTAEYAMLPASTGHRKQRDGVKRDGRGVEISRLIGIPSSAKYSHCTGINTESDAVKALTVSTPSDGGQSINI